MTLPAYASTGTYVTGSATSVDANVPSGSVDEIIVVTIYKENTDTVTPPAGFTEDANSPNSSSGPQNIRMHVFWKRAVSGDNGGGNYTFSWTNSTYRAATASRYSGAIASGNPWDTTAVSATTTADVGAPAITLTTSGSDRLVVYMASSFNGGSWTEPTGFTERVDLGDITVDDKGFPSAGSTGSIQATQASSSHVAWAGALIPAVAGAVQPPPQPAIVRPSLAATQRASW